ncbi:hypothetical protein FAF44_32750 [Nonomuraea sp. MG754425]|uniref:hypothetical protein n=1 Tax=Nonomuraea sp. MG754425 TaxID=2570319 RepID=UPI001F436156|nr:hypothetical protein [Nonomuraea sp. MG754425]MCF6473126.1 hypothetical protein [Nonomuraea sp. MG754425]
MAITTDVVEERARSRLRHGLRIATLLVAVVTVVGLGGMANMLSHLDVYESALAQVVALVALSAVLAGEGVLLVRRRSWGRLAGPAIAVVLVVSALSYATLPEGRTSTGPDWIFGAANWVGVVVLLDRPLRYAAGFLVAHELTALLHLVLFDDPSWPDMARYATGSVGVVGFPLCVAVVTSVLDRLSAAAVASQRELEEVRVAEAVVAESHRRRRQRFAELSVTTVPLLEGLADGSLRPEDPVVQRRCAIEAARMRRLFAETDTVADPLMHELRHCADVADRKGVVVELDARGQWPVLPVAIRRDLTEAVLTVLATAASRARVTVMGDADLVSVSVVADCGEVEVPSPATPDVRVETLNSDDTVWMEVRWQPAPQSVPPSASRAVPQPVG